MQYRQFAGACHVSYDNGSNGCQLMESEAACDDLLNADTVTAVDWDEGVNCNGDPLSPLPPGFLTECDCGPGGESAICPNSTCLCGPYGEPNCTCDCLYIFMQKPRKSPIFHNSKVSLNFKNTPLTKVAQYFDYLFPNQIFLPASLIDKNITYSVKGMEIHEVIDKIGLRRSTYILQPNPSFIKRFS